MSLKKHNSHNSPTDLKTKKSDPPPQFHKTVPCDEKVHYSENPLDFAANFLAEKQGPIYEFISGRFYPMYPLDALNYLCWKARCDFVWRDFWKLHGCVKDSKKETEGVFWATFKMWLPKIQAYQVCEPGTLVKEIAGQKTLYFWIEHTFELRGVGYNGNPPNPWVMV